MKRLLCVVFSQLVAISTLGQSIDRTEAISSAKQSVELVQSLYGEVIPRHPLGIPSGANWRVFAPYLSKPLLHRIGLAQACARDWVRQDQKRMLMNDQVPEKAPFGWAESGLFSGADERTEPDAFIIEGTESENDGSIRIYVELTLSSPPPETWDVAVKVVTEDKRPLVDDVIYLKGDDVDAESRLSDVLVKGCNDGHWVG